MNLVDTNLDANPTECLKGFEHTHENAKCLLASARLLATAGKIGPATSLAILAGEEAIKSFLLFCSALESSGQEPISAYPRSHQRKHDAIRLLRVLSKPVEYLCNSLQDWLQKRAEDPSQVPERPWPDIIPKFHAWVEHSITDPASEMSLENDWWKQANQRKNEGFYVDFKGGTWKLPSMLTPNECSQAIGYSEAVVEALDMIRAVPFEDHLRMVKEMKQQILRNSAK